MLKADDGGRTVTGKHDDLPAGLSPSDNELGWRMSMSKLESLAERRAD